MRLDPVAQLLGRIEKGLDLAKPGEGEVPVVTAREGSEQRDAFQAEEVRQRMLVDHGSVDTQNTLRSRQAYGLVRTAGPLSMIVFDSEENAR